MKLCRKCKQLKDYSEFYRQAANKEEEARLLEASYIGQYDCCNQNSAFASKPVIYSLDQERL